MAKHAAKTSNIAEASTAQKKSRYVAALDGLRAFAVLAVIAYHMGIGWAPGGLMGVTVFFVISGYLISGLLVAEHENTGRISLKSFWLRRVRRLFPAILLSVVGTAALCTLMSPTLLDKMRPDIAPSLLFFNNWWQIFRDMSYFEAAGAPSPLTHFWSLSIEEQFYIVWPILLVIMYRIGMKKKAMSWVVLVLAVLSAVEMALLYDPMGDPSRIYYGTDTRAMSLLAGVWLAFVLPSAAFGTEIQPEKWGVAKRVAVNLCGVAAFAGLVVIVGFTSGFSAFPYLGGIALTTVLSAVVIAVLVVPRSWLARIFAFPVFVYIGKRSYSMYLWHLPLLLLTSDVNAAVETAWWMRLVQLVLIIGVSELSFRFVEDPIRKRKLSTWLAERKAAKKTANASEAQQSANQGQQPVVQVPQPVGQHAAAQTSPAKTASVVARVAIPSLCFVGLLGVAAYGVVTVEEGIGAANIQKAVQHEPVERPKRPPTPDTGEPDLTTYEGMFLEPHYNEAGGAVYEPLLIGDSVSLGAEGAFYETFPYGHLDSVVSRNIWESPYGDYLAADEVGEFVVFCLGTNNAVVDSQIDELLAPVSGDKHVIVVNTRSTTDWFKSTNEALEQAPKRHSNVTLVDWYAASEGHAEYFAGDGTHLTPEGARAYVDLIQRAVKAEYDKSNVARLEAKEQAERVADTQWAVQMFFEML